MLRRYLAIERPTEAHDDAFAAELGLHPDQLVRMAAAMRRLGEWAPVQGDRTRVTAAMRLSALQELERGAVMDGVAPARLDLLRARLEAVRDQLRDPALSGAATEARARAVGLAGSPITAAPVHAARRPVHEPRLAANCPIGRPVARAPARKGVAGGLRLQT